MRAREAEAFGGRLARELPGYVAQGRMVFAAPIGHAIRGIYLDQSEAPMQFYAQVFLQPLFVPVDHVGFNIGWRLGEGSRWKADDTSSRELITVVKRDALPFLGRIRSPQDVAEAAAWLEKPLDPYVQQAIAYAYVRSGESSRALAALNRLVGLLEPSIEWKATMRREAEALKLLVAADSRKAQAHLASLEQEAIRRLGLERYA